MKTFKFPSETTPEALRRSLSETIDDTAVVVSRIVREVRIRGDEALREFTATFDRVSLSVFRVSKGEIVDARSTLSSRLVEALEVAYRNIDSFHRKQVRPPYEVETMPGVLCGRMYRPLSSVGIYVPGGSAPLFSSLLMVGIPAKIAEVPRIVVVTPPREDGTVDPAILFAASLVGIDEIYTVGGAQAVAALAYGTESIAPVDKICGPGNSYVDQAKRLVASDGIAIDLPAGPSEILVIGDEASHPAFIAADLLAQAEHGPDSVAILVTPSERLWQEVQQEIARQRTLLKRSSILERSLERCFGIITADISEAIAFSNRFAPEHLLLQCRSPREYLSSVTAAGSVFLGERSPEAFGDYMSGTNHTLPTAGAARGYSGVSVDTFTKGITWQEISEEGFNLLAEHTVTLAEAEGLDGHAASVVVRGGVR